MKSNLISKILGVGVSAGMVIALSGALFAAPVAAKTTEWSTINTPSWKNGVILPASDILDYDISGENGEVIYVVALVDRTCDEDNPFLADTFYSEFTYGVFKSTDGGVTWKDITQNVLDTDNLPDFDISGDVDEYDILSLNYVSVAPDDADWVAVTGYANDLTGAVGPNDYPPFTVASKDGGDNFAYAGDMEDDNNDTSMDIVYDTEVSLEIDDLHVIAAMGASNGVDNAGYDQQGVPDGAFELDEGTVFLLNAGTWLTGSWDDAAYYEGWDGSEEGNNDPIDKTINSLAEVDGEFGPDGCSLVVIGVADDPVGPSGLPYVQTGTVIDKQWGAAGSMPDPIKIEADGDELWLQPGIWMEGIALPADYDGTDPGARVVFGYVNGYNNITGQVIGFVFRLDNDDVSPQVAPSGSPILASIAVTGDADTGKMMIGEYAMWDDDAFDDTGDGIVSSDDSPCDGVRVWHTEELDICCPVWKLACKYPSGPYAARVMYTPDGTKEYATTTGTEAEHAYQGQTVGEDQDFPNDYTWGNAGDESAFSVSLDDATSFNQLGLIDTDIDKLSDMVICPDCSVMYLSTINDGAYPITFGCDDGTCIYNWAFDCDSVWRSFDNGKTWERVNHGSWTNDIAWDDPTLLLRLPCEDVENCCDYSDPSAPGGSVYLGIQGDDDIFYSRDCGQCWTKAADTKIDIQDFVVGMDIVYVLDIDGNVSTSSSSCRRWTDSVDTGAGSGHMIALCCANGMVVVGPDNLEGGDAVAWSDDGGDTWNITDDIPIEGQVHVACATTCEGIIFIAVDPQLDEESDGAIYRTDITSGTWDNLNAAEADYTGIAVGRSDGTLYASTDYISYDHTDNPCDRNFGDGEFYTSAVARNLTPCETACCGTEDWDYLICGLDDYPDEELDDDCVAEDFDSETNALDICGCLTSATNTKLWAIDNDDYDVRDGSEATLWNYEDCASKVGPTLLAPADGTVLDCLACEDCSAQPFTMKWDRICNSCSYDIEIMDEDGNIVMSLPDIELTGTGSCTFVFNPQTYVEKTEPALAQSAFIAEQSSFFNELVCGSTYKWHVREANTTCECIHSQWSATWSFTIATSSANGVRANAPGMAATNVGVTNVGFSWTAVPGATSYSFVLSPNANLSGALVSQEIGTTAFNYAGPLEYGKTYYWQVKAWKGTTLLSTSPIAVFTTMGKPVEPQPPVVVQQTPAPQINIPPAQQITPTWIYAAIGISAALAVVVIVLIVRTRRP